MAERDQFVGALGGHDAGDTRGAQRVALLELAGHQGVECRATQGDPAARLLVSGGTRPVRIDNGSALVTIDAILDHEVIVLG